jgi:hypothetical protein
MVLGEPLVLNETVDQPFAFACTGRVEEIACLGDAWYSARQFEIGAAKEDIIAGRRARLPALGAANRIQPGIDPSGQLQRVFARIGRDQAHTEDNQDSMECPPLNWVEPSPINAARVAAIHNKDKMTLLSKMLRIFFRNTSWK